MKLIVKMVSFTFLVAILISTGCGPSDNKGNAEIPKDLKKADPNLKPIGAGGPKQDAKKGISAEQ